MKNFIIRILTATICVFFFLNSYAQQGIQEGIFTIERSTYEITKSSNSQSYLIWNLDRSELTPNREMVDGIPLDLAQTKMTNGNELQKIVCEALGKEKREQLMAAKEKISGWIYYRADGTVINVMFKVDDNTKLTLDDLAAVENTLQQRFKATLESRRNLHRYLYYIRLDYEWDFGR